MSDYLDKTLTNGLQTAAATHVMSCPLCHSLMNEVKASMEVCREIAEPTIAMTRLEAQILERTMPERGNEV